MEKKKPFITTFFVVTLLASLALQCVSSMVTESPTVDEPNVIGRGITHLSAGREVWHGFLIGDHHPPLPFMFSAVPLLFTKGIECEFPEAARRKQGVLDHDL